MKFEIVCPVVILAAMLQLSAAGAAPLSTGGAQKPDIAQPVVRTQLNMIEYSEVAQAPLVKTAGSVSPKGSMDGIADKISKSEISLSPALLLFGVALTAIGWMGRKRKKSFLVKD